MGGGRGGRRALSAPLQEGRLLTSSARPAPLSLLPPAAAPGRHGGGWLKDPAPPPGRGKGREGGRGGGDNAGPGTSSGGGGGDAPQECPERLGGGGGGRPAELLHGTGLKAAPGFRCRPQHGWSRGAQRRGSAAPRCRGPVLFCRSGCARRRLNRSRHIAREAAPREREFAARNAVRCSAIPPWVRACRSGRVRRAECPPLPGDVVRWSGSGAFPSCERGGAEANGLRLCPRFDISLSSRFPRGVVAQRFHGPRISGAVFGCRGGCRRRARVGKRGREILPSAALRLCDTIPNPPPAPS